MITDSEAIIILRAVIAALLGFVIGWQRESTGASAGDRTFALMSLGVASLTAYVSVTYPNETARVIAGLLTGIGFLGGGMIMRAQTGRVRGLTTAASLWASTSIGVLVGTGHYLISVALTILVLCILAWERLPFLSPVRSPRVRANACALGRFLPRQARTIVLNRRLAIDRVLGDADCVNNRQDQCDNSFAASWRIRELCASMFCRVENEV